MPVSDCILLRSGLTGKKRFKKLSQKISEDAKIGTFERAGVSAFGSMSSALKLTTDGTYATYGTNGGAETFAICYLLFAIQTSSS